MGTTVFGVKIILQDKASPVAENTAIGLYNVAGDNSAFRWVQNSVSGLTTWKEGMIVENGLKDFSLSIELAQKGNTSYPGKGEVVVKNTAKFWQTVQALGVYFPGLKLELYLFNGTAPWRIRTYECEEPTFDSREYRIPFKGAQEGRVANIMNVVTSQQFPHATKDSLGRPLPATFGKLYPAFDASGFMSRSSLAKFMRVSNEQRETDYTNATLTVEGLHADMKIFPVVYINSYLQFYIRTDGTSIVGYDENPPSNVYCIVVSGNGEGQIRRVQRIQGDPSTDYLVTLATAVSTDLSAAGATRSWVKLVRAYKDFYCDHWVCKSFLDSSGAASVENPDLYAYVSEELKRMADYGYTYRNIGVARNSISVDPKHMDGDLDTVQSYLIRPASNLQLEDAWPITHWSFGGTWDGDLAAATKLQDGIFKLTSTNVSTYSFTNNQLANAAYACDRNSATFANRAYSAAFSLSDTGSLRLLNIVKFDLPELPQGVAPSNIHVIVKLSYRNGSIRQTTQKMVCVLRRFRYNSTSDATADKAFATATWPIENTANDLPDFFCSDAPNNNDKYFYRSTDSGTALEGVVNFELNSITAAQYVLYREGAIIFYDENPGTGSGASSDSFDVSEKIYEVGVAFKLADQDISQALYVPISGRTFAYTWQGRKTATNLIEKPADIIEHACRLQNYRDTCYPPPSGWGLQYADAPLIGTSGHGSFDDPDLTAVRAYCAAAQLTEKNDGFTDKVKQTACRDFAIANWQDQDGVERILALPRTKLAPVYTVTLDDVLDRNKVSVLQKRQKDIYAEPLVRFQKNPASGEYEKLLAVKNTSHTLYLPSYVEGVENAGEAEALWRTAHSLALKSHQANEPPADLTDLVFADGPGGYTVAYNYLKNWLDWQLATDEIEFSVHVNTAASWQECTPINVLFSHQTNNVSRSALVESSVVTPNPPYEVMIKAIMYA